MDTANELSITRRGFCVAAGLGLAACAAGANPVMAGAVAPDAAVAATADLPEFELLGDGDLKTYLLVFHTGQEVMKGLLAFAREQRLVAGHLTGIGAISEAVVGYFDPETNRYLRIREPGQHEVLSVTGNLALYDGAPFYHVHVALGLRDGSARGGHLFEMTVRPTVELVLTTYPKPMRRTIDPGTGLPLLAA
ncbi:MAG TPA: PPC domain-containing DNA-binding protein [Tepidisphaeraceae bacterium]|jgi:hypothetical protein